MGPGGMDGQAGRQAKSPIVLTDRFLKVFENKTGLNDTQYGMISEAHLGKDGKVRSVTVKYRNHIEEIDRYTTRATRQLIKIYAVGFLGLRERSICASQRSQIANR